MAAPPESDAWVATLCEGLTALRSMYLLAAQRKVPIERTQFLNGVAQAFDLNVEQIPEQWASGGLPRLIELNQRLAANPGEPSPYMKDAAGAQRVLDGKAWGYDRVASLLQASDPLAAIQAERSSFINNVKKGNVGRRRLFRG